MLEPFKYLIQAVAIERDDTTGRILRELPAEVVTVYDASQAADTINRFETEIRTLNEKGGVDAGSTGNGVHDQLRQPGLSRQPTGPNS